jgi:hypothetical protein
MQWPTQGLAEFTRQMLGHLCAEYQIRIPSPAYRATRDADFPGLAKSYESIGKRVRAMLSAESPPPPLEPLPPDEPPTLPIADQQPAEGKTFTDEDIKANELAGNPRDWPLSGREWLKLSEKPGKTKIADGTDFNVHTGGPLDPNEI